MSLVQDIITPWPLLLWFPLSIICLHIVSVQNVPNANRAGVKTVKCSPGEHHFFFSLKQRHHTASSPMWGFRSVVVPVPSQSTTITMTMPALVTLNTNKQDLNKVISRSQNQNSKEGQSVFGVFGIKISRSFECKKQLNPALSTNLRQREIIFMNSLQTSIHAFSIPAYPVQGCGVLESIPACIWQESGDNPGQVRAQII